MATSGHQLSVCFVALHAYNLLSGRGDISHIGGAEVQQVRIASWLARRGYSVSFITLDHGQADGICCNNIAVWKAYAKEDGIRGVRFIHPRWSSLWAAMTRANAKVYYQRGAGCETGQVASWCRVHGRRFVFAAANESDCCRSLPALESSREKLLYRVGLWLADAVIAQTVTQQTMLRRDMGLATTVIRNCGWDSVDESPCGQSPWNASDAARVLWVGRISEQKRFDWLLDVAERCPEMVFDVVAASNTDSEYARRLTKRAASIPNVRMHGRASYPEMVGYYRRCHVLCCTSAYEGFPNTFLEAWSLGVPVVSTFDPDGVIAGHDLGWVVTEPEDIAVCLRAVFLSPEARKGASEAARHYYFNTHTPDMCLPPLERLLLRLTADEV